MVMASIYLPFTLLAPIDPVDATVEPFVPELTPRAELSMPNYGASSLGAVGFADDLATGGTDEALPIASITKIITALVVLEEHPLGMVDDGPTIAFGQADVDIYYRFLADNGKVAAVSSSLKLTQREVLDVVLVESANNYAESLVVWAFGSEMKFLEAAQTWLRSNGLAHTSLADSTGMSPKNVSTAIDLVRLGKLALENPVVSTIVATKEATIPGIGKIENTNDLLGMAGVRGIKTGTLDEAGACLLFASDIVVGTETVVVVGVVLGATDHTQLNKKVSALLSEAHEGFSEVQLARAGESFATLSTPWGTHSDAIATKTLTAVVWSDTPALLLVKLQDITVAQRGEIVGELVFTVGERSIRSTLELESAIADPGVWWRLTHPVELL
jgi:D-alanyl-D-alanine carboxypeptidase (penicillin-binding protein 5/6)